MAHSPTTFRTEPSTFAEVRPGRDQRAGWRAPRADRLPPLVGLKLEANAVLDALAVLFIGTGAVGGTTALSLARLHVGELRLLDRGHFTAPSLLTQPIGPADIGKPKASTIARQCKLISPRTRVLAFDGALQALPHADMAGVDVVVLAGDNATVEQEAGQRCLNLGLTLVHVGVEGATMTAQCRVFGARNPQGPCPVCLFGAQEFRMLQEERGWSCEGPFHPEASAAGTRPQPTLSLRPLCALAGEMAALFVIRLALRLGRPVQDTLTEINAYTWRTFVTPLRRNPACPCRHQRFVIRGVARALHDCTLRELLRVAGCATRAHRPTPVVVVEGFHWVERGRCQCPGPQTVNRFVRAQQTVMFRCPRCRQPVTPQPFYTRDSFTPEIVEAALDRPLRALGAADCRGLRVECGEETMLLTNPKRKSYR